MTTSITPARTLLDLDAEPVGGWWPDDVGPQPDRVEGPLHPRVGTRIEVLRDVVMLPEGTIVEQNTNIPGFEHNGLHCYAKGSGGWWTCWRFPMNHTVTRERIIGATILYVPLEEP